MCLSTKRVHATNIDNQASDDDGIFYVGTVKAELPEPEQSQSQTVPVFAVNEWTTSLEVNGKKITVKLDTGAKCNVLSKQILEEIGARDQLKKSKAKIVSYGGHKIDVLGHATLLAEHKGKLHVLRFYVIEQYEQPILGLQACQELNLIQRVNEMTTESLMTEFAGSTTDSPVVRTVTTESLVTEFADVFDNSSLGCLPTTHTIKIKENAQPVIHAPRKVPVALRAKVKDELDRMQRLGVLCPVDEPTDWVSSMVVITSKPNKTRICIDPRDLNQAIRREHYPMQTIEEIATRLPEAKVFSTLDATNGYWQIPVDEKSSKLLTFNTPHGRFRFCHLPFGISSASEVFHRTMLQRFGDIEGCEIIVDDIPVWGRNT